MREHDFAIVTSPGLDRIVSSGVVDRIAIKNGCQVVTFCGSFWRRRPHFVRKFQHDADDGELWGFNAQRLTTWPRGSVVPHQPRDEWGPL